MFYVKYLAKKPKKLKKSEKLLLNGEIYYKMDIRKQKTKTKQKTNSKTKSQTQKTNAWKNPQTLLVIFMICTLIFICAVFFAVSAKTTNATPFSSSGEIIVIDAGHGGIDNGASGNGLFEADLNLQIAKTLQKTLENLSQKTVMTRKDKNGLYGSTLPGFKVRDMKARKEICENAGGTILISLHQNASTQKDRTGVVIYCDMKNQNAVALAKAVALQFEKCSIKDADLYITKKINATAILIECGFITTKSEAEKLSNKDFQQQISQDIARGILLYQMTLQ